MSDSNKPLWFLDSLAYIRVAARDGVDGLSVIEFLHPQGSSPPLHIHLEEDELFHVMDGRLRILKDGKELILAKGETALAPRGKPHTFRVESETARVLIVTRNGQFEHFVRTMSRPASSETLPPMEVPTPEQIETLTRVAHEHKIEIVGPPLS
jgi:quercetin dioxygenase-like cupin family protein